MLFRKTKWFRRWTGQYYTVDDLKSINEISINDLRRQSQIVIIDDEIDKMSTIISSLRNNGFTIKERKDVSAISDIEPYDIVICDVQGVAHSIDKEEEGYGFLRQVSKIYPFKGIGVYSGISYTLKPGVDGMMVIQKDDSTQTWIANLDEKLKEIRSPLKQWKWISKKLCEHNVPSIISVKVEDDYVDRVINNKSMEGFPSDSLGNNSLSNLIAAAVKTLSVGISAARICASM